MIADSDRLALEALRMLVREVVRQELAATSPAAGAPEGFIGTAEAARRAGVAPDAVLEWITKGLLPATKPGGTKAWRIRPAELDEFLAGRSKGVAPVSIEAKRAERAARIAAAVTSDGAGKGTR